MKPLIANSSGHIIVAVDDNNMLVDTGAARTFHDEYEGVRVTDLSRMIGVPLDGVMGMDRLQGRVVSLTRTTIQLDDASPGFAGIPLAYTSGTPVVDIRINGMPCRAALITGATTSYVSEQLLCTDKLTGSVDDMHPLYGRFKVDLFVNYFSISDKNYFAQVAGLPAEFSLLSTTGVDAIIGMDLLDRFNLIMDFAGNRFNLVSR